LVRGLVRMGEIQKMNRRSLDFARDDKSKEVRRGTYLPACSCQTASTRLHAKCRSLDFARDDNSRRLDG